MARSLTKEIKIIARHSSVYGLANVANRAVSLLMLPVYTRFLTPADYGILEILYFVFTLISIVLQLGISDAMSRFFFDSEEESHRHKVVSTTILGFGSLSLLTGLALMSLSTFTAEKLFDSAEFSDLFVILFVTLAVEFAIQTSFAYYRVAKQSVRLVIFSIIQLLITVGLNILFLAYYGYGVKGILLGTLIANVAVGLVMILGILRRVGLGFSWDLYRQMVRFGLPLIPSSIATYLMIASDRYFIKEFVSLQQTGLYSLGYKLGSVMHNFVTSPFIQIWFPRRYEYFDRENSEEIFSRIFTYFTAVLTAGALAISLIARDILMILTTEPFWPAAEVVPLIALAHVFHAFYYHFAIGISYKKKTVYYVYINISVGLLNLILNFILIRKYGIWGAACSTILTYIARAIMVYYFSNKLYPIVFEKTRILKILVAAGLTYALGHIMEQDLIWIDLPIKLATIAMYPVLLWFMRFFRPDETRFIRDHTFRLWGKFFGSRDTAGEGNDR